MIDWLKENGKTSTIRIVCLACVFTGCLVGVYAVHKDRELLTVAPLVAVYLAAGITGKVTQKKHEVQ